MLLHDVRSKAIAHMNFDFLLVHRNVKIQSPGRQGKLPWSIFKM